MDTVRSAGKRSPPLTSRCQLASLTSTTTSLEGPSMTPTFAVLMDGMESRYLATTASICPVLCLLREQSEFKAKSAVLSKAWSCLDLSHLVAKSTLSSTESTKSFVVSLMGVSTTKNRSNSVTLQGASFFFLNYRSTTISVKIVA